MKLLLATLCVVLAASNKLVHGHDHLRVRYLGEDDNTGDIILENNSLFSCITLIEESNGEYRVGFRPCSTTTNPSVQMWTFEADGKVRSRANENLCWTLDDSATTISTPPVLVLTDCDSIAAADPRFSFDFSAFEDQITIEGNFVDTLCLKAGATDPEPFTNEIIEADECGRSDSFLWIQESVRYITIFGIDGGCIIPRDSSIRRGNALLFANCDSTTNHGMLNDWWQDGAGLIHTRQDADMCWQGSHCMIPEDGNKMRLYPCDGEPNQRFQPLVPSNTVIKLQNQVSLCGVASGDPPVKDVSEIIFKACGSVRPHRVNTWTFPSASDD